jgi:hypothetical protein
MKIPSKISIGEITYRIKIRRFVNFFNSDIHGSINYGDAIIKLKQQSSDRTTEDIFFHELAHGILKEIEYNYPQIVKFRNDEKFVQEMGLTLRKSFLDLLEHMYK